MIQRLRASVVLQHEDRLLAVALEDPASKVTRLFLPGGAIEAEETPEQAALRETLEETGYVARVDATRKRISRYPFHWNGADYDCTTHYFPARLADAAAAPARVNDAPYHRGVVWVPLTEVERHFDYDSFIYGEILALLADASR